MIYVVHGVFASVIGVVSVIGQGSPKNAAIIDCGSSSNTALIVCGSLYDTALIGHWSPKWPVLKFLFHLTRLRFLGIGNPPLQKSRISIHPLLRWNVPFHGHGGSTILGFNNPSKSPPPRNFPGIIKLQFPRLSRPIQKSTAPQFPGDHQTLIPPCQTPKWRPNVVSFIRGRSK